MNNHASPKRVYVIKLGGLYVLWNLACTHHTLVDDPMQASSWSMASHAMAMRPKVWVGERMAGGNHRSVLSPRGQVVLRHLCAKAGA